MIKKIAQTEISKDQNLQSFNYDTIILPRIEMIFGTRTSSSAPIVGTSPGVEKFTLEEHKLLLKSLDIRGDIEIRLKQGLEPLKPVLIYVLEDVRIRDSVTIYTNLDLTLRARKVFGPMTIVATRAVDGEHGHTFAGKAPAKKGADGPPQINSGRNGDPAKLLLVPITAEEGGKGPDGNNGKPGEDGDDGGDGTNGTDSNSLTLWVERFEDGPHEIIANGGNAGVGGDGQEGGAGGAGSKGGAGGRGGNGVAWMPPGKGGVGGKGGRAGDGGHGGRPGRHGKAGEGGEIKVWGPNDQNAKPPTRITTRANAGEQPAVPAVSPPGKKGPRGPGGDGGSGGRGTVLRSDGEDGSNGDPGDEGSPGGFFPAQPMPPKVHNKVPSVNYGYHPSQELEIIEPFLPEIEELK